MNAENEEILRTYKNGLKIPASLINPFNELVREREVLQFLIKYPKGKFSKKQCKKLSGVTSKYRNLENQRWECFKAHKNLVNAFENTITQYEVIFLRFLPYPQNELESLLKKNGTELDFFKRNELNYDSNLNLKGAIKDSLNPNPTEISLSDYQNIARKYLKKLCGNSHKYALDNIETLPTDETLTERKVTKLLGNSANHLRSVSTQMATMMNVNKNTRRKLECVKTLLEGEDSNGADFSDIVPIYLSFYSVPNYFRNYIAKIWKVDSKWVRNTLVGWRRKLDPFLPKSLKIEPLTQFMDELANFCKGFCKTEDEMKIISILQKKHVLHLLNIDIPLKFLIPQILRAKFDELRKRIKFTDDVLKKIDGFTIAINADLFNKFNLKLKHKIMVDICDLDKKSTRYKRSVTFLNKLNLLYDHFDRFTQLFYNYLPGNRYTSSASKIIVYTLNQGGMNKKKIKRLFTALRGVIAPAFTEFFPTVTAMFREHFTPDNCVTRPFTSNRNNKKYLPLELKSPKYVVLRKKYPNDAEYINNEQTTELFKENKPLWLGFNIYTPDQFLEEGNLKSRNIGTLWFRLFPTKKIMECLKKGAIVKSIRLNVPRGASNKIIADITLGARSRKPFSHASLFLNKWEGAFKKIKIPESVYLGKDLNRLGKFMIAIGNATQEIDISEIMAEFEREYNKLEGYRKKIIPHIQRNLVKKNDGKKGRRETEITNIHNKRHRIMAEYNRRVLMVYLYCIYKSKAQHVSWDGIEDITTRGKRGNFAMAIQYLPNSLEQFESFSEWLEDLKCMNLVHENAQVHLVSPFTSMVCPVCYSQSGKLNKNRDKTTAYHDFRCKICGYSGNRHSSAAMVEAISVKHTVEGIT